MAIQQDIVTGGRYRRPSLASGVRHRASYLPSLMARKQEQEYLDRQQELQEEELALREQMHGESMEQAREQHKFAVDQAKRSEALAKGTLGLQTGLTLMKHQDRFSGAIDSGIDRLKLGASQLQTKATNYRTDTSAHERYRLSQKQGAERSPSVGGGTDSGMDWGSAVSGGVTGGLLGGSVASLAGGKKKWQSAAAGAAAGAVGSWLAGSDDIFSIGMGGLIGGGMGMLF